MLRHCLDAIAHVGLVGGFLFAATWLASRWVGHQVDALMPYSIGCLLTAAAAHLARSFPSRRY